jgi:uncharacterized protein (TIGR02265 family)
MPEIQAKASALINRFDYVKQRFGPKGLDQVLAKLATEDARAFNFPNADWYPLSLIIRVDRVLVAELLGGDVARMAEVGEFTLENSLTTIYRFLFRVLGTETMLQNGVRAFRKLVSQGAPVFENVGPKEMSVRFEGFDPGAETYCHFLRGAIQGVLKANGVKSFSVTKTGCVLRGQACCTYLVRWE